MQHAAFGHTPSSEHFAYEQVLYVIPSESDIDTIRELIEHAARAKTWDLSMYNIITEETAGYFSGDMTEDDTIKAIGKRTKERLKDL